MPVQISSFLDLRNGSSRFRLFARDFQLFRFFFSRSACFSKVIPSENLQKWVKYHGKSESFGKEFLWTKFKAVERVIGSNCTLLTTMVGWKCFVQPIPFGLKFSKALSKLKAQSSKPSFYWNLAKETFELWALSFEIALETVVQPITFSFFLSFLGFEDPT